MKKKRTWFLLIIIFILLFSVTLFYGLQNRPDIKINLEQFQAKLETNFGEKIYKSKEGESSPVNEIERANWKEVTMTAKYDDQLIGKFENSLEPDLSQVVIVKATPKENYAWEKSDNVHETLAFKITTTIDEREVLSKVEFINSFKNEASIKEFNDTDSFDNFIENQNNLADKVSYQYETLVPANNATLTSKVKVSIEIKDIKKYVWDDGKTGSISFEMEITVDNRSIITVDEVHQALLDSNESEYENVATAVKHYTQEITLLDNKANVTTVSSNKEQTKLKISVVLAVDYKWDQDPKVRIKEFEVDVKINTLTFSLEALDNMIEDIINKQLSEEQTINELEILLKSQTYLDQSSIAVQEQEEGILLIKFKLQDQFKWSNREENEVELEKAL
ncbi:hypothetical protein [Mesoplasma seiffertii]|uniref:hypothetical protein n=1 Tax=Mesoplasma seiffertii TaxID=28224 RepID=UPI00047B9403|nr:hypothetical protein [Mesoplasma seiffertii]